MASSFETQEQKLKSCEMIAREALTHKTDHAQDRLNKIVATEKLDRVLLHPGFGFLLFVIIMGALFSCYFGWQLHLWI